jgi:hypothetical protein
MEDDVDSEKIVAYIQREVGLYKKFFTVDDI